MMGCRVHRGWIAPGGSSSGTSTLPSPNGGSRAPASTPPSGGEENLVVIVGPDHRWAGRATVSVDEPPRPSSAASRRAALEPCFRTFSARPPPGCPPPSTWAAPPRATRPCTPASGFRSSWKAPQTPTCRPDGCIPWPSTARRCARRSGTPTAARSSRRPRRPVHPRPCHRRGVTCDGRLDGPTDTGGHDANVAQRHRPVARGRPRRQ
jgi:hypothetical protein